MPEKIVSKSELLDMAKELGVALASSQIIYDYREAERIMANDEEACRLTRVFKQKNSALAALNSSSGSNEKDSEALRFKLADELEVADKDMKAYPLIAAYYSAGGAFNTLIYQINQLLKFYSMEPGEDSQFESSSGCGKCGDSTK